MKPLVQTVLQGLVFANGSYSLPEKLAQQVRTTLAAATGQSDFLEVVRSLVTLAFFLEHKQSSPKAAETLLDIVRATETAVHAHSTRGGRGDGFASRGRRAEQFLYGR